MSNPSTSEMTSHTPQPRTIMRVWYGAGRVLFHATKTHIVERLVRRFPILDHSEADMLEHRDPIVPALRDALAHHYARTRRVVLITDYDYDGIAVSAWCRAIARDVGVTRVDELMDERMLSVLDTRGLVARYGQRTGNSPCSAMQLNKLSDAYGETARVLATDGVCIETEVLLMPDIADEVEKTLRYILSSDM